MKHIAGLEDIDVWQQDAVFHIDVRGLLPPQPMVAVLSLLDSGAAGDRLIVHIDREPFPLYQELEERRWIYETSMIDDGHFQLVLSKMPDEY